MERGPLKSRLPDFVPNSGWAHTTAYFLSSMHVLIDFWGPKGSLKRIPEKWKVSELVLKNGCGVDPSLELVTSG